MWTRKFITTFTVSHHLPLSWGRWIQSMHPSYFHNHWNIIIPSTPISFKWSISFRLPTKSLYAPLPPIHATSPAHLTDDVSTKCNYRSITSFSKWNKWTENRMWPIQAFLTSHALGNIREIHVICVCIYCYLGWVFRSWIWGSFDSNQSVLLIRLLLW